jgi:hypothetical protein
MAEAHDSKHMDELVVKKLIVTDLAQITGILKARKIQGFSPLEFYDQIIIYGNGITAEGTGTFADLALTNTGSISTSASIGSASALPSLPEGYLSVTIDGNVKKIPYYN